MNEQQHKVLFFLVICLGFFWPPSLVFVVPGILIVLFPLSKKWDLLDFIGYAIGLSLSFWIVSFWFLLYIPLTLTQLFAFVLIATIGILLYYVKTRTLSIFTVCQPSSAVLILFFYIIALLRFLPLHYVIVPSGADMSMHTYMSHLIVKANGVPSSYYPILDIESFSLYSAGFHTITALLSLLGKQPVYYSALFLTCVTYILLSLFLFLAVRRRVSNEAALLSTMFFTLLTQNPQGFIKWGGNPTIFALVFFFLFVDLVQRLKDENKLIPLLCALAFSTVLLTHVIIFMCALYVFVLPYLFLNFLNKSEFKIKPRQIVFTVIIMIFLLFPYIINFDFNVTTPEDMIYLKLWMQNQENNWVWKGTMSNSLWTIPLYFITYLFRHITFFIPFALFILYGLNLARKEKVNVFYLYTLFIVMIFFIILNSHYWILLFSYVLYPDRVSTFLILPFTLFASFAIEKFIILFQKRFTLSNAYILFIGFLLMSPALLYVTYFVNQQIMMDSAVTQADLEAIKWLDEHSGKTDLIHHNIGDAGLWIPAIIMRPITVPLVALPSMRKPPQKNISFVYIGKKMVYPIFGELNRTQYEQNISFSTVYDNDGVVIFKKND